MVAVDLVVDASSSTSKMAAFTVDFSDISGHDGKELECVLLGKDLKPRAGECTLVTGGASSQCECELELNEADGKESFSAAVTLAAKEPSGGFFFFCSFFLPLR